MIVMEKVTNVIVKTRYWPIMGMDSDVDGIISIRTSKKKVNESRIEIVSDTCKSFSS